MTAMTCVKGGSGGQRFNLVDERWLPVAGGGKASLSQIFMPGNLYKPGGNARQKIAVFKFLLAIAQAACTPEDDQEWADLGATGLAERCAEYLQKWHHAFYLYGDRPFLQMPVQKAKIVPFGSCLPEIATGNNPRLMHSQCERETSEAERALILVTEMSLSLGGKKADKQVCLAPGITKRTAPPGPGTGTTGFLHTFLTGQSLGETVWLNLLTRRTIAGLPQFPVGLGTPPWEKMPVSEDCPAARALKGSLMGRLVPLSRFCLLAEDGMHYTEGIAHPGYESGVWDTSVSVFENAKKPKFRWANPEQRPWRFLPALLAFLNSSGAAAGDNCLQARMGVRRRNLAGLARLGIWSGGLAVNFNVGEQYVSGNNDYVESEVEFAVDDLDNADWYPAFADKMGWLERQAGVLTASVKKYYSELQCETSGFAGQAGRVFWEEAEKLFPRLLNACACPGEMPLLEKDVKSLVFSIYDEFCPQDTARQICAWAEFRPNSRAHPVKSKKTQ